MLRLGRIHLICHRSSDSVATKPFGNCHFCSLFFFNYCGSTSILRSDVKIIVILANLQFMAYIGVV